MAAYLSETQRAEVRSLIEHILRVLVPAPSQQHHIPQSAQYTVALPGHGQITDATGAVWAVTAAGKITLNGTTDPVTGGVARLIYEGGHIWQLAPPYGWYSRGEMEPTAAWAHDPTGPVSADGKQVTDQHDAIIDAHGYVAQRTHDGKIAIDGTVDPVTKGVELLQYHNKQLWQQIKGGAWYFTTLPSSPWTYSASGPDAAPIQPPSSGSMELGLQASIPWGSDGYCQSLFVEFSEQMQEAPTIYCDFIDPGPAGIDHAKNWHDSAVYCATGMVHANTFPGSGKITTALMGFPMVDTGSTWQKDFAAIARGDWDHRFVDAFDQFVANGLKLIIRPGWEMNGTWYLWSVTPENAAQYVEAFRRMAAVAHGYTKAAVKVCWNPSYIQFGSTDYTTFYAGDDAVDYIGQDIYGAASGGGGNDSPFREPVGNTLFCVEDAINFSLAHNKPLCYPETGCGPADVDFPTNLKKKLTSSKARVNFMSLWNQTHGVGTGGQWSSNPACGEEWRKCIADVRAHNSW
jgi:hypothetical protein